MSTFLKQSLTLIIFGALLVALQLFAFTEPSVAPPGGNVPAPVNVGGTTQNKSGWFTFEGGGTRRDTYLATAGGNVGIGTAGPGAKLDVAGQVKITGGTPAAGEVLTSDAAGLATWEPGGGVPAGAVMFFNLAACPSGWSALVAAQGRYLVGLPSAGTLAGTAGTALSNQENRAVGQHTHPITDPGHSHSAQKQTGSLGGFGGGTTLDVGPTGSSGTGITIQNAGSVAGTNAPYIQLLVCQKS